MSTPENRSSTGWFLLTSATVIQTLCAVCSAVAALVAAAFAGYALFIDGPATRKIALDANQLSQQAYNRSAGLGMAHFRVECNPIYDLPMKSLANLATSEFSFRITNVGNEPINAVRLHLVTHAVWAAGIDESFNPQTDQHEPYEIPLLEPLSKDKTAFVDFKRQVVERLRKIRISRPSPVNAYLVIFGTHVSARMVNQSDFGGCTNHHDRQSSLSINWHPNNFTNAALDKFLKDYKPIPKEIP